MSVPEALTNNSTELYVLNGQLNAIRNGVSYTWEDLPEDIKIEIRRDLYQNPQALELLKHLDPERRLWIYAKCKFGGYNETPDISHCGKVNAEHWDCNCQDCPLSELFRGVLKVEHGYLTKREIEITRLIAAGFLGKVISARLGISENTLNNHKKNIFQKVGVRSNVELAVWATKINLG